MSRPLKKHGLVWLFILLGVSAAIILAGTLLAYRQGHDAIEQQFATDQLVVTRLLAGQLETKLKNIETGLSELALDIGTSQPEQLEQKLARLQHKYSPETLKALFIRDGQGNILASADPKRLANGSLPIHLLNTPTRDESGQRLIRIPEPCMLISERSPEAGTEGLELIALLSLKPLITGIRPAPMNNEQTLLFDVRSELITATGNEQTLSTTERLLAANDARHPAALKSVLAHGEGGALMLSADGSEENERLFSFAPTTLAGNRFSLGRLTPVTNLVTIHLSRQVSAALLLCTMGGILALALVLNRSRRQSNQLHSSLESRELQFSELERRCSAAQLRSRQLLAFAGDAMFFLDPEKGRLVEQNQAVCELLGYSSAELARLELDSLFPGQQKRRYQRLVKKVRKHGYGEEGELQFRRKDGTTFIGAVHARLGTLGEQQVVHGTVRDVSALKQIEQELRRRNRDLALLNRIAHSAAASQDLQSLLDGLLETVIEALDTTGGGIFLVRHAGSDLHLSASHGIPTEVSQELRHIQPGEGLIGRVALNGQPRSSANLSRDRRRWSGAVRKDDWRGFLAVPIGTGERTLGVLFIYCRKERVFTREETQLLVAICKQAGTAVEGTELLDALRWQNRLTEASNRELEASRHRLKQNLFRQQEATRTLERLESMKNNFLALASHELRTPLTYILSGSELLLENDAEFKPQQQQMLKAVHRGGLRLQEIVNDLLEVARLEAQTIYLGREKIDIAPLLRNLGNGLHEHFERQQLQFTIDLLPDVELFGDPDHLSRALQRILENAIKFTPPGGLIGVSAKSITAAELLARQESLAAFTTGFFERPLTTGYLQLTISDTGLGIDPNELTLIFDKFYEVGDIASHSTSQTRFGGKGVGLGLTLVRGMIEAHGGMIWASSNGTTGGGQGSSFHLVLPLEDEADEAAAANA